MKYKEIDYNKLETVIKCLSLTCKYKCEQAKDETMVSVWDEVPEHMDSILTVIKSEVEDIHEREINEREFSVIIAIAIFVIISLAQEEIFETLDNNVKMNGRMSMWDMVEFIKKHHNRFYNVVSKKILDTSIPILMFALIDEDFADGSRGGDKTVDYNSIEDLLMDVVNARLSTKDNIEIWKSVKEILPKAMDIIKTHFRNLEISEKSYPALFANSIISSIVSGANINILADKIGVKNLATNSDFDSFENFDLIKEILFPPISWWIKKEFGEEVKESSIEKSPHFNPTDYGWKEHTEKSE